MSGRKSCLTPLIADEARKNLKSLSNGIVSIRLLAIIRCAEKPIKDVADFLGYDRKTIYRWIKAFSEHGVEGLRDRPKGHYSSKLTEDHKKQIEQWILTQKDSQGNFVHWTIADLQLEIERVFGITISYTPLRLVIHKMGFKQKVPRPCHIKADEGARKAYKKKL